MNILGLVVARSGSKRLPKKNISAFLGKPLIEWTYECLSNCKKLQNILMKLNGNFARFLQKFENVSVKDSHLQKIESTVAQLELKHMINGKLNWN